MNGIAGRLPDYEVQEISGGHAGLTKEEIKIPLIVVER